MDSRKPEAKESQAALAGGTDGCSRYSRRSLIKQVWGVDRPLFSSHLLEFCQRRASPIPIDKRAANHIHYPLPAQLPAPTKDTLFDLYSAYETFPSYDSFDNLAEASFQSFLMMLPSYREKCPLIQRHPVSTSPASASTAIVLVSRYHGNVGIFPPSTPQRNIHMDSKSE